MIIREHIYRTPMDNEHGDFSQVSGWRTHAIDLFGDKYVDSRKVTEQYTKDGKILAESIVVNPDDGDYVFTSTFIFDTQESHDAWLKEANIHDLLSHLPSRNVSVSIKSNRI